MSKCLLVKANSTAHSTRKHSKRSDCRSRKRQNQAQRTLPLEEHPPSFVSHASAQYIPPIGITAVSMGESSLQIDSSSSEMLPAKVAVRFRRITLSTRSPHRRQCHPSEIEPRFRIVSGMVSLPHLVQLDPCPMGHLLDHQGSTIDAKGIRGMLPVEKPAVKKRQIFPEKDGKAEAVGRFPTSRFLEG